MHKTTKISVYNEMSHRVALQHVANIPLDRNKRWLVTVEEEPRKEVIKDD